MATRKNGITGIHIEKNFISLAQYLPDDRAVASIVIKPLDDIDHGNSEALAAELKKLVAEIKFSGQDVVFSLPSENAIIKRTRIDPDEDQIDEALVFELGQQIIGSLDEYVFDFERIVSRSNRDNQEYLLVAFRNNVIKQSTDLLKECKLNPLILDLDVFALVNAFEANYPENLAVPALICYGEEDLSKLVLTHNGTFLDYEPFPSSSLSAEQFANRVRELTATMLSVNPGLSSQTLKVYLAGALFSQIEFTTQVVRELPNSQILNPFKNISCRAEMAREDLEKYAPQMVVAVGLVVRESTDRPS